MSSDIIVPELTQNALSLLVVLSQSAKLRCAIINTPIRSDLKALKNHNDEKIKELAEKTIQLLEQVA
ncbi:hypothetical protein X975_24057, partial [Stegodyphus mimosarum]